MSFTISWSLLTLMSIEAVMPSNHLILGHPLLLLPSIRVFSNESTLSVRWPKYWSYIYTYIYLFIYICKLNHFAIHLKLTQLHESAILQKKKKKKTELTKVKEVIREILGDFVFFQGILAFTSRGGGNSCNSYQIYAV